MLPSLLRLLLLRMPRKRRRPQRWRNMRARCAPRLQFSELRGGGRLATAGASVSLLL